MVQRLGGHATPPLRARHPYAAEGRGKAQEDRPLPLRSFNILREQRRVLPPHTLPVGYLDIGAFAGNGDTVVAAADMSGRGCDVSNLKLPRSARQGESSSRTDPLASARALSYPRHAVHDPSARCERSWPTDRALAGSRRPFWHNPPRSDAPSTPAAGPADGLVPRLDLRQAPPRVLSLRPALLL